MKKILLGLFGLVFLLIAGIAAAIMTFDVDKLRPQLVELLSKQTGRTVKLGGPIKFGLSASGASLTIQDAAIGNPQWASRPDLAGIGHFELGIALMPLLNHELVITKLEIANADILLESSGDNKHNWEMAVTQKGKAQDKSSASVNGKAVTLHLDHIAITDSQLALRDAAGTLTKFQTTRLTYGISQGGVAVHFDGKFNGKPITLNLQTDTDDLLAGSAFGFDAAIGYAPFTVEAKGDANFVQKTIQLDAYNIMAGQSNLSGKMSVALGGEHPSIKGSMNSSSLNPADFKTTSPDGNAGGQTSEGGNSSGRVFSDAPLPFDSLKSVNADLDINLASVDLGKAVLNSVSGKIDLQDGALNAPIKANLGKNTLGGVIKINGASKPPQINIAMSAPSVDMADLLQTISAPAFISGNAKTEFVFNSSGYSMHNLAGGANGVLNIVASGGTVSSSDATGLSAGLMQIFAPKGGNNALNCLAARFNINNGIMRDNGILIDSVATTIAGRGNFNLGLETINMQLHAKPKLVNVGGAIPPIDVAGTFAHPSINFDSASVVQNVVGIIASGNLSGISSNSNVPDLMTPPAGQNSCVYTLDHPAAKVSEGSNAPILPGVAGGVQKLKGIGGELLKGLFNQQ